jgi:hypothetical protein
MAGFPRPHFCPFPVTCQPVIRPLTDSDNRTLDNPSFAVTCFGDTEPLIWVFNDVEHREDLRSCHYSPLKGVVTWHENLEDWDVLAATYRMAAEAVRRRRGA